MIVPINWKDVKDYPASFTPDNEYVNVIALSVQKDGVEQGVVVLRTIDENAVEAQLYVKEEHRGRTLTRDFWKQIYNYVFNVFNFKVFIARTQNPLMANILKREKWIEIRPNIWFITKDKVRYNYG